MVNLAHGIRPVLSTLKIAFVCASKNAGDAFYVFNNEIADDYKSILPEDKAEAVFLTGVYPILAPLFTLYAFGSGFVDGLGMTKLKKSPPENSAMISQDL
jgi:hypothetical protein